MALLLVEEARRRILNAVRPLGGTEQVALGKATGRVLARPVRALRSLPPLTCSAMDGFALRAGDVARACSDAPVELEVMGTRFAGAGNSGRLGAGQAWAVATGAPVPSGADAVVMVESVVQKGNKIWVSRLPGRGAHVRLKGEDVRGGQIVLPLGRRIRPFELALMAALGVRKVLVRRVPRVAVISLGDELIRGHGRARSYEVYDSNSLALAGLVRQAGLLPVRFAPLRDRLNEVWKGLRRAAGKTDCVISTGGVSVGQRDLLPAALSRVGRIAFAGVAIKPGKPVTFGFIRRTPVFGLPGNPGSALVTFLELVLPALRRLAGYLAEDPYRQGILERDAAGKKSRQMYLWALARERAGVLRVRAAGPVGSHRLRPVADANALMILPPGTIKVKRGTRVWLRLLPAGEMPA